MGVMTTTDPRQELARRIRERRHELGLNQDLRPFGGPSDETIRQWERGNFTAIPRAKTLLGLDNALRWQPGTSSCILAGGGAKEHHEEGQTEHPEAAAITALATRWQSVPAGLVADLQNVLDTLALQSHLATNSDPRTSELITTAHSLATSLARAATTS